MTRMKLVPLLLNVYVENAIKEIKKILNLLKEMMLKFVDDIVVITKEEEELETYRI